LTVEKWCSQSQGHIAILLFTHFCCMVNRLATMHSVTDRQTERQHYDDNSRSYLQYCRSFSSLPFHSALAYTTG